MKKNTRVPSVLFILFFIISSAACGATTDEQKPASDEEISIEPNVEYESKDEKGFDSDELKNLIDSNIGKNAFSDVQERTSEIRLFVYFDRKPDLTEDQIHEEMTGALTTSWESMKVLHEYLEKMDLLKNYDRLSVMALYPNDGGPSANTQLLFASINTEAMANVDWNSDDFTQLGKHADKYQWNAPKANLENYEYADFSRTPLNEPQKQDVEVIASEEDSDQKNSEPPASDTAFDEEWFKTYTFFEQAGTNHEIEFIWYDDGAVDIAIDGLTIDSFDSKSYVVNGEGGVTYACAEFDVCYYPNDRNSVQISKGDYAGYYYPQ